jgi:hypothetical protein
VSAALAKGDKKKGGLVGNETFCEVIDDMSLPYSFSNEKHWSMLHTDMGGTASTTLRLLPRSKRLISTKPPDSSSLKGPIRLLRGVPRLEL